jgi:hypothetical protein
MSAHLLAVEVRRALHRRSVWGLLVVALAGTIVMGTISLISSAGSDPHALMERGVGHPSIMRDWWLPGDSDGALLMGGLFLLMGGVIGGATATGGEWRTGTLPMILTWEPRRVRLALHRLLACAVCALVIAILLQAVLMLALLPSVLINGTTRGVDGAWTLSLIAGVARIAIATSAGAVLAAAVALGLRSTAAALGGLWVWFALVEPIVRGVKPWMSRYLVTDNVGRIVLWFDHAARENGGMVRSPTVAMALVAVYLTVIVAVVVRVFARSDAVAA